MHSPADHPYCAVFPYDFAKPWVTHQSLQRTDFYRTTENTDAFIEKYRKPAVWDEICYEGNIGIGWGNITAQELVRRFWEAFLRGGHAGHGETFMDENDILWWSHGGILKGESAPRIAFLRRIMEKTPGRFMRLGQGLFDEVVGVSLNSYKSSQTGLRWEGQSLEGPCVCMAMMEEADRFPGRRFRSAM